MDQDIFAALQTWRRHLHAHPELSLEEQRTAAFVSECLTGLGIPHETGIGGHGVVATLSRGQSNRSVGLRADMDALPVTESTGKPWASTRPGVMHACGHDGHTASLLGAAALLASDPSWSGTVQFVFQPAEEGFGGAQAMLSDGLLDRFPMERIFGFHNWPGLDAGTVAVHDGAVMAGASRITIALRGRAGHAALPHLARDPMLAAAHLIVALQSIVARSVDPLESAVISICMVDGGTAANLIPSEVVLRGTSRTLNRAMRDHLDAAIRRVSGGVAATFGMESTTSITYGIDPTVNTHEEAGLAAEVAAGLGAPVRRDLPPAMTGEDFCWYLDHRPGAFVWIGNGHGGDLHAPDYDFNDTILPVAAGWLAGVARRSLGG